MQLWPVAHFFSPTFGWVQQQSNSKPTQKWVKKVGNRSELHSKKKFYTYKLETLALPKYLFFSMLQIQSFEN